MNLFVTLIGSTRRLALMIILSAVLACGLPHLASAASVEKEFLKVALGGRANTLDSTSGGLAMAQPLSIVVAGRPEAGYQIGFTHSGYTGSNSTKQASLLITLDVSDLPLSASEKQQLMQQGYFVVDKINASAKELYLDISLQSDPTEEARLRQELKFPRAFSIGTLQLAQITWSDVDGTTLYNWLTGRDGLLFVLRGRATSSFSIASKLKVREPDLLTWWFNNVGDTEIKLEWSGGPMALAYEFVTSGIIEAEPPEIPLAAASVGLEAWEIFSEELANISSPTSNGKLLIDFDSLDGLDVFAEKLVKVEFSTPLFSSNAPGVFLDENPSYVIDNTSGDVGLKALLRDGE